VAAESHDNGHHQLKPEFGDVPEVQPAAAFLGVQVVTLQVRESDDEENQDEYEGSGVEEGEGEEADVAQHRRGGGGVGGGVGGGGGGGVGGGRVVVTLKLLDVYIL